MKHILWILAFFSVPFLAPAAELTPPDAPLKLELYGTILANTYFSDAGVVGSDVPLWVVPGSDARAGDEEFGMTARQSRFGLKLKAPDVGRATLTGVFELDLFGSLPNGGQRASFGQARLRLANMKLEGSHVSLTAGQDWIVLTPLNPTTLSHFAVVGLAASGNLWLRYPQLRLDAWARAGSGRLGLTGGLVRPVGGSDPDNPGAFVDAAGAGERSGMPFFQARAYYSRPVGDRTLAVGLSGHHGKEQYRFGTPLREEEAESWAYAGDAQIPLGRTLLVQGEIFTGRNLDSFQGGINQGVVIDEAASLARPVDSRGGWVQVSVTPPRMKKLALHVAWGVDDPDDAGQKVGQRARNETLMGSVFYKPTTNFQTALEVARIETEYVSGPTTEAVVLNLAFGLWF